MANKRDISEQIPHYLQFGWLAFRPKWLKLLNSPKWFLFFLVMYFFTQSIVVNGVYSVSISTIEKRYGYSSSLTGFLTSSFDIAALVLTPLVSFLGARRKKPVWCGVGLLTMGIGMLIFFLPHVFSGRYEAGAESESGLSTGLCNSTSVNSCEYTSGNKGYVPLFVLGMLVMGSGATPMIALGIPYMDENVKAKASPMYVGIFYASGLLGCLTQINGSLAECSCLLPSSSRDIITMGKCRFSCGYKYGILLGAVFLFGFFTFMNMTPATTVTLRCLPVDRRTYGLGFQMTMTRLLGAIPGPIAFGTLIDWNCILWDRGCDDHGNCLEYNNTQLAYTVFGLCFVCKLVTTLSYFVAFVYCRKINRSLAMGVDTAEMSGAVVSGITNESLEIEACVKTETTTHL
ncbi:predicted protein [Nematostella vectensis]|uniref:Solute carrier organic anion transporter family member n=1 Tax=Nematostella vectensis TaxID=45351 RepID=A7T5W1_NEMVE|nr:predicted protein [Nematostella vectensis]|eukprot:XP_001620748.1 hypothetical protein NEMVEDRAFT_v1g222752 [Nematostella vectensis]